MESERTGEEATSLPSIEAVERSPIGLYVLTGYFEEREVRELAARLRGTLGPGNSLLLLEPGQSFEALSVERAQELYRHLGERLELVSS